MTQAGRPDSESSQFLREPRNCSAKNPLALKRSRITMCGGRSTAFAGASDLASFIRRKVGFHSILASQYNSRERGYSLPNFILATDHMHLAAWAACHSLSSMSQILIENPLIAWLLAGAVVRAK